MTFSWSISICISLYFLRIEKVDAYEKDRGPADKKCPVPVLVNHYLVGQNGSVVERGVEVLFVVSVQPL